MPDSQPPRSTLVTTIAWIFIVLAGFSTVMGLMQTLILHFVFPFEEMKAQIAKDPASEHMPPLARAMFDSFEWVALVFLSLSAGLFASAIGLLKRQNWARLVFIGLMLLGVVWNLAGPLLQQTFMAQIPPMPADAPPAFQEQMASMQTLMSVFSLVIGVGFAALFGWIAWRLRSPAVVAEFRKPG